MRNITAEWEATPETLPEILSKVHDGDIIHFRPGIYKVPIVWPTQKEFVISVPSSGKFIKRNEH